MNLQALAAIILALYLAVAEYGRSGSIGRAIGLLFMLVAFFILGGIYARKVSDKLEDKQ